MIWLVKFNPFELAPSQGPKNVGTVKHKLLSTLRTATSAVTGDLLETVANPAEDSQICHQVKISLNC